MAKNMSDEIPEPALSRFIFSSTKLSWFWLILRVYVGYEWISAGWSKINNPVWVGPKAGVAVSGFLNGALEKTSGPHPDVSSLYAHFIQNIALPNASTLSYLVSYGELLVGIGLVLGAFTGIAAFFGAFMNMNYLFAGTISTNPVLFLAELFLILAWRVSGWIGVDKFLLPILGTPWKKGKIFK